MTHTDSRLGGLYHPASEHDACGVGFVVDMKGRRSHTIVEQGLTILKNLQHRGACGCEENTGDGAGILVQIPHAFLARECNKLGVKLPMVGEYGTGLVFLPRDAGQRAAEAPRRFLGFCSLKGFPGLHRVYEVLWGARP